MVGRESDEIRLRVGEVRASPAELCHHGLRLLARMIARRLVKGQADGDTQRLDNDSDERPYGQ